MNHYNIRNGQRYARADGCSGTLLVIDCDTYADVGDVVVRNEEGREYRIDSFKLAMVRYYLME